MFVAAGVQNILAPHQNHMKDLGDDVTLQMYHPILTRHYLPSSENSEIPLEDAKVYEHRSFQVTISPALTDHLKKTDHVSHFSDRLKDSCASATLDDGKCSIVVTPLNGSQYNPEWSESCRAKVREFQEGFEEETIKVPPGVAAKVYPVIIANTNRLEIAISMSHSGDVVLVGRRVEVENLKTTVHGIVYQNLDTVVNEPLPPQVLVYIKKCSAQRLENSHRVLLKVDIQNGSLQISGTSASCDSALKEIRSLTPVVIDVKLGEEGVVLLATPTGSSFLYSKIGQHPVGHYFTGPDGSVVQGDMAKVSKLHLVAEKHRDAISIAEQLQKDIAVADFQVPKEFFNQLQYPNWDATRRSLEINFVALLTPKNDKSCVVIACDEKHLNNIKESLQEYCDEECYRQEVIALERGELEYLEKYSNDWARLIIEMKEKNCFTGIHPTEDKSPSITLTGEVTTVREFTGKVRGLMGAIAKEKKEISPPGIAKNFLSTAGKDDLERIGSDHDAVVHVTMLDEQYMEEGIIRSSSSHLKLCTGMAGGGLVNIMFGDLTKFHVDVIVNVMTESPGVLDVINHKGGPGMLSDLEPLNVGEPVLRKTMGSFTSKAIVHALGPKWGGGFSHQESVLEKTVYESLIAATEYRSIGFPAISPGAFGVTLDKCAQVMLKGIVEFFKDAPHSNLSDVTIMLLKDKSVPSFLSAAHDYLENCKPIDPSSSQSFMLPTESSMVAIERGRPNSPKSVVDPKFSIQPRRQSLRDNGQVCKQYHTSSKCTQSVFIISVSCDN